MADETPICVICHEDMESHHHVVQPNNCTHTFHAICIQVWLANHRSCPVCRRRISLATQMPWRTLFMTALVLTQESTLERAAYTYSFLSVMLRRFSTAESWNQAKSIIIVAAEQLEAGIVRLPYLDLSSRTTAKREKQKWATLFAQIQNDEPSARKSPRVKAARRWILDRLFFMFTE